MKHETYLRIYNYASLRDTVQISHGPNNGVASLVYEAPSVVLFAVTFPWRVGRRRGTGRYRFGHLGLRLVAGARGT